MKNQQYSCIDCMHPANAPSARPCDDPGQPVTRLGNESEAGRVQRITEELRVLEQERKFAKVRLLGVHSRSSFKRVKPDTLAFAVTRLEEPAAWTLSFGGAATIESPATARDALRLAAQRVVRDCLPTAVSAQS
jgi:hypothetical protein